MLPGTLLFISGAAALVYQTLWVKQLGLVVGVLSATELLATYITDRAGLETYAGYYAYTGETDRWESMIRRLVPEMRDNPYFLWFVSDKR